MSGLSSLLFWVTCATAVSSVSITDIQGTAWQSPLVGQAVANLTGIVTAKVCIRASNMHICQWFRAHKVVQSSRDLVDFILLETSQRTYARQMAFWSSRRHHRYWRQSLSEIRFR